MLVQCSIRLPRDMERVTQFRHDVDRALREDLGVGDPARADVELVVSEVCANVMAHVVRGDQFDIAVLADAVACVVEVRPVASAGGAGSSGGDVLAGSGSGLRIVAGVASSLDIDDDDHPGLLRRVRIELAR
jgi:anti-sigma regulatory factor (Ser/Thr protein kinase)